MCGESQFPQIFLISVPCCGLRNLAGSQGGEVHSRKSQTHLASVGH